LLIHGARAVVRFAEKKVEPNQWPCKLMGRRNKNVATIALANKNARIVWALLTARHSALITLRQLALLQPDQGGG